jgi:hypothetical protein
VIRSSLLRDSVLRDGDPPLLRGGTDIIATSERHARLRCSLGWHVGFPLSGVSTHTQRVGDAIDVVEP